MSWIGAHPVGARFRDALAARARAGVKVLAIHDAVGSLGITPAWWRPLSDAGGRVLVYHSISPFDPRFRLERVEHRDHRKLLVTDGIHAYTGGINLASPWLTVDEGGAGWRDDAIEGRGEATQELRALFFRTWRNLSGERPGAWPARRPHRPPRLVAREPVAHAAQHPARVPDAHPPGSRSRRHRQLVL